VATVKTSQLGVSDRSLEMVRLVAQPIYCSVALSNSCFLPMVTYRCLLKMQGCQLVVRQPPALVHKRVQQLLPAFTQIYQDVFSSTPEPATTQAPPQTGNLAAMQMPSQLPQGYTHFSMSRMELIMTPLPSLSITYTINPLVAHVETTQKVHYQLSIGSHTLRFNPREQQVTLRSLVLPTVTLGGDMRRSQASHLPLVSLTLTVQKVNVDLTTDSLNQLLVLQNSFIKEVNELAQLFISIGESLPQQRRQQAAGGLGAGHPAQLERRDSEAAGPELLSLLDSCRLVIDEISVTVSTPLSTALRFQTSRIDMLIMNSGSHNMFSTVERPAPRSQLLLSGRVDINVNLALGYLTLPVRMMTYASWPTSGPRSLSGTHSRMPQGSLSWEELARTIVLSHWILSSSPSSVPTSTSSHPLWSKPFSSGSTARVSTATGSTRGSY
jgi:hypothetical protein